MSSGDLVVLRENVPAYLLEVLLELLRVVLRSSDPLASARRAITAAASELSSEELLKKTLG